MLIKNINDPRLAGVFVNEVKVDRELAFANIYVSVIEGQDREKEVLEGMNAAKGFFRKMLAENMELRSFPQLRFYWDPTPEHAAHIEEIFAQIRRESPLPPEIKSEEIEIEEMEEDESDE